MRPRPFLPWLLHVAAHESGHGVVAMAGGIRFRTIEIFPDDCTGIINTRFPAPEVAADYPSLVRSIIAQKLAGPLAGAQFSPDLTESALGCEHDFSSAKEYATAAARNDAAKTGEVLRAGAGQAERLVRERWDCIRAVAAALVRHRILDEEQVRAIVRAQSKAEPGRERKIWHTPFGWPTRG